MTDVVICNFPPMLPWWLPAAPAVLAGACNHLGLTSKFLDFNINFQKGDRSISSWADEVISSSPKIVAISLFSYKAREWGIRLSEEIKKRNSTIKIVVGGAGVKDAMNGQLQTDILDNLNQGIFDHYIVGDGEHSFLEFLANEFDLNYPEFFDALDVPYFTDYSDYDLDFYSSSPRYDGYPIFIPISGSRGCVRNCTFCEVPNRWSFRQRSPESIAREIKNILKTVKEYDVHIHFTDSLVNGSLPAFEEMLDLFLEIKKTYPKFNWGGQFIIRRAKQSGDDYWKKIADTGGRFLNIGVETGSDRLRQEMKKHFSNEDLFHSVKMMAKYGVNCVFLMFTGMPTETKEDFQETLKILTDLKEYKDTVITEIELGYLTTIGVGSPLYQKGKEDPDMILTKDPIIWYNKNNPDLNFQERINRRIKFEEHARKCGYAVSWDTHIQIEEAKKTYHDKIKIINIVENKI